MKRFVAGRIEKKCYEYCCWNCLHTWITDEVTGPAIKCPNCNGSDLSVRPMSKRDLQELKINNE